MDCGKQVQPVEGLIGGAGASVSLELHLADVERAHQVGSTRYSNKCGRLPSARTLMASVALQRFLFDTSSLHMILELKCVPTQRKLTLAP